jgi:bifunctional DNA-binding transcriptional regulator/antitoxin component of YhaV-PrlF toxin-antitoxin module
MMPIVVQGGNTIEIPAELAKRLGITAGSQVYVYQLGETLSVRPKPSQLLEACEEFETIMLEEGVTLDDLLKGLEEEREAIAKERRKGPPRPRFQTHLR